MVKIEFENSYLFSEEIETKVANETAEWKYQTSATEYALKGDYANALKHWDLGIRSHDSQFSQNQIDSILREFKVVNAADYIVKRAKENRVVIINEAHHNSLHRVFTRSLLKELYNSGYKYIGVEALGNGEYLDFGLNSRMYPIMKTGYYTKEPQFGNLIREALEIGFELFAYDNMKSGSGRPREIEQAKNIKRHIDSFPDSKFLIYCGYDHALEGNHDYWDKAMAARLTEFTGINPLTINQVLYSEKSKRDYNHPLLNALDLTESIVLTDSVDSPLKYDRGQAWTDIAVFHPETEYIDARPNWLFQNGFENVEIDLSDVKVQFPLMVLAFKKGEDINQSVPVDIFEVQQSGNNCHLALKKGVYTVVVTNKKEAYEFEKIVN